jgi:flagellar L-ring protein precursor FlgH
VLITKKIFSLLIITLMLATLTGCSSFGKKLKGLVGGGSSDSSAQPLPPRAPQGPSFSTQPSVMTGKERKYKRVTKENFSDEQAIEENAGSLWRKEGQGSYLFSQNNLRVLGDVVNVNIEGRTADNLSAKIKIIKAAWAKFDRPPPRIIRKVASANRPSPDGKPQVAPTPAPVANDANNEENDGEQKNSAGKDKDGEKFDEVPCRIVEKNTDGSYRVKGQQTVFIGKREYKLIVTGVVRPDDISADNISSTKIIDGKFDLMASNKETRNDVVRQ